MEIGKAKAHRGDAGKTGDRKIRNLPLINADRKNQKNLPQMIADQERAEIGTTEERGHGVINSRGFPISASLQSRSEFFKQLHRNNEEAGMRENRRRSKSRNMSRYPIVLKDYGIVAYFARGFRYNEQALVYSGLLAGNAALASENAAFTAAYRLKDRPQ